MAEAKQKKIATKTELNLAQTVSLLILLVCGVMVLIALFMGVFLAGKELFF